MFLSINNKTQCVSLLCLSPKCMTYDPSFIAGKFSLEKNIVKPRFIIQTLSSNLNIAERMEQD